MLRDRDGAGRTYVWWQVRHWWYNHVSGPLGAWWRKEQG